MLRDREERKRLLSFIRYGPFMLTGTTQLIPALRSEPMFLQQTLRNSSAHRISAIRVMGACPNWAWWTRWTPSLTC